jgi:CRP-like cAMP-binding protein
MSATLPAPNQGAVPLHHVGANHLLALLPGSDRERLLSRAESCTLRRGQMLYKMNGPISHVYFLQGGMVSLVRTTVDGDSIEVGTIGNEGMVGAPVFLAVEHSPTETMCQVAGEAVRMSVAEFKRMLEASHPLQRLLQHYTQALMNQMSQSVVCNRAHAVEQRIARWLLMTHDRVGADEFLLTQQFLAQMLGVHRPSVSIAAGILQKAGLIRYARGRITVLDRPGLENASCECYAVVRQEFERLL